MFDIDVLETLLAYGITVDAFGAPSKDFSSENWTWTTSLLGPSVEQAEPLFRVARRRHALLDSVKHLRGGEVGWKDDQRKIYALVLALKVMRGGQPAQAAKDIARGREGER